MATLSAVPKNKYMADDKVPHRLRGERKAWGFTQAELALLLGCRSGNHISRVERAQRRPNIRIMLASHILFGRALEHLFKSLYDKVEERVIREAYGMHTRLAGDDNPKSKRKCELLAQVMKRASDRHKSKKSL